MTLPTLCKLRTLRGLTLRELTLRCVLLLAQLCAKLSLLLLVVWLVSLFVPPRGKPPAPPYKLDPSDSYQPHMKTILFWGRYFNKKHFGQSVGHKVFPNLGCPEHRCFAADRQDGGTLPLAVEDFDIVVFHGAELVPGEVPLVRKHHQKYVFFIHESPGTNPQQFSPWDGFFNLTATYRRDSDIYIPYGWVAPRSTPRNAVPVKYPTWLDPPVNESTPYIGNGDARRQRDLAAWLTSNCINTPSNRDVLVRDLSQFAPIAVFGACGRACFQDECDRERLAEKYDFYMALENSLCRDYVTEKLFLALKSELVPVVLGGADYSLVAPPRSYINAADFASPRQLAEHLLALQADRKAYERHFWWKAHYEVRHNIDHMMCQLCAVAHNTTLAPRVVGNLHEWWHDELCAMTTTWIGVLTEFSAGTAKNKILRYAHRLSPASAILLLVFTTVVFYLIGVFLSNWIFAKSEQRALETVIWANTLKP